MTYAPVRAVLAVAATYVYFLLYAQFGFLKLLQERLASEAQIQPVMVAMGVAGLVASLAAAVLLRRVDPRKLLATGYAGAGLTAVAALGAHSPAAFVGIAVLIGVSTALVTVVLAASLGDLVSGRDLPLAVGAGTGLAYFLCNVPGVFEGSPAFESLFAAAACGVGLAAVLVSEWKAPDAAVSGAALRRRDHVGWGFASLVLAFLALVWLDSAAFAVIQETAALKGETWGSEGQKLMQGSVHLLAAVAAGWAIRRGFFRSLLLGTYALFATAFLLLEQAGTSAVAGPLYAVGISTYSVALVVYPSAHGDAAGLVPRRWRAALLYGVAGWLGSALGVGMAQNLHRIPHAFLAAAGVVLVVSALTGTRFARTYAGAFLGVAAGSVFYLTPTAPAKENVDPVTYGRRVYVEEGCIHCHSQYVRPRTEDVVWWGPARNERDEQPPLYGNRRQGPDLTNAGSRRSEAWHRLHLRRPRAVVPTSRMPSYEHLFQDGRGEALVAYLASLGAAERDERFAITRDAPLGDLPKGDAARGHRVFQTYCKPCHGEDARGDGPLAEAVYRPAMNLHKGAFWSISWGPGADETQDAALARLVKFGVPGTSMPGHEYFTDRQIADVVAFVTSLEADPAADEPEDDEVLWP